MSGPGRIVRAGSVSPTRTVEPAAQKEPGPTMAQVEAAQQELARKAEKLLAESRQTGFQEGFADGQRQGLEAARAAHAQQVQAEVSKRMETAGQALAAAAIQLAGEHDRWLARWENDAVALALAIAKRIVDREISVNPEALQGALRETLSMIGRSTQVQIFLNERDAETLALTPAELAALAPNVGSISVVADRELPPGSCRLRSENGTIDASLQTQLDRIAQELLGLSGPGSSA